MSICVMRANCAVMSVFLFIVLAMGLAFLILYIATYGHLLSLAFLAISTILWWLMISLIIRGLFPYMRSLRDSPFFRLGVHSVRPHHQGRPV